MRSRFWQSLLLATALVPAARAQFGLFVVDGAVERPAPSVYDFGTVYSGETASARFRIRNTSAAAATVSQFAVAGVGFTVANGPALPVSVAPQAAIDFTVAFQASGTGTYSAALRSDGISALLVATVAPRLTYAVNTGSGLQPLGASPVNFGTVERGSTAVLHFTIVNQTALPLTVPAISVAGDYFAVAAPPPGGILLGTQQTSGFEVQFSPGDDGTFTGSLTIGDRTYLLTGNGVEPPLPRPVLRIDLPQGVGAQQGSVAVMMDAPSRATGTGVLTLEFEPDPAIAPAAGGDPAIAFANGTQSISFTVWPGDTQGRFGSLASEPFQAGTTAGTLTFTVVLGGVKVQQSVTVAPAAVAVSSVQASRSTGSIQVQVTGFDNTRTAGPLAFTFFDAGGNPIAPGTIHADGTAAFASFFSSSGLGGVFALKAVFPITGNADQIVAVETEFINSAGTAQSPRTNF
jgi:hypothetical protein